MRHIGTMRGTFPYSIPTFHKDRSLVVVTRVKTMWFAVAAAVGIDPMPTSSSLVLTIVTS